MIGDCSSSAVFSIYANWINSGETRSRHLAVGRPRVIKRKRTSEIVPLSKAKSVPDTESAESPIRFRSKYKCLETHRSADTVGYGTP
ncbi:uncharacterized protein TNCV_799681 [Trichonephila clavipes]|nr:uncharacterized protein TNCV_799681 [Trichonephila clavipes]